MKKLALLFFVMIGLLFTLNACSQKSKPALDKEEVEESNVLDDVKIKKDQSIEEYTEEEVDDYNDETEKRSTEYNKVIEGSSGDDF